MGKQINKSIVIDAKVKATLEGMNKVVSDLNQGLRDGATKIDLTKGIGSSLSKNIDKFKDEYSKFSKFIENGKIEFADAKDAVKSGDTLLKTFKELKRVIGDFNDLSVIDAKKLFPDAFDSKVSGLLGGLEKLALSMSRLESKQVDLTTAQNEMQQLTEKATELQAIMQEGIDLKINADQTQSELDAVEQEIEAIRKKASEGITLKINTATEEAKGAKAKKGEIEAARAARGFSEEDFSGSTGRATKFKGKTSIQWQTQANAKNGTDSSKAEAKAALEAIRVYEKEKRVLTELSSIIDAREKEAKQLRETLAKIGSAKLPEIVAAAGGAPEEITEATAAIEKQKNAITANTEAQNKYKTAATAAGRAKKEYDNVTASIEQQQAKISKLTIEVGDLKKEVSTEALEKAFSSAGIENFNVEMLKSQEGISQLRKQLNELDDKSLVALKDSLMQMGLSADAAEVYIEELRGTLRGVETEADGIKKAAQEIDNLKSQVLQFFSITNSVQLFKRGVQKAINTIKELDAAMTETAVVTDFSVDDMWQKLPEYTKNASALGAKTKELYEATTLYYQQGLKGNEVMEVGIETMKMARIANMDATEATKAMTAALRGFNMEVNKTNATRINDVYSELAAITAADTSQIATAMEKTASIAKSANMEFETTAALLAQIIETTQEAPETAGTAMKTIIARFSEVKELQNRGEKKGEDEEGEEIDVNKIDKALKSVGISMNEFFAGTKGLDDVLLELAGKWDSLDFTTQRYIATMAAGSRQQSRFIAMMSNYSRTVELVDAANNSAGASQKQFEKTLDSLEAKMNKLTNAWEQFLMGIANNSMVKGAIDMLRTVLEVVNKLIKLTSFNGKTPMLQSLVSLLTAYGALKGGKFLLGKGFDKFKGNLNLEQTNKIKKAQEDAVYKTRIANAQKEHAERMKAIAVETKAAVGGEGAETQAGVAGEQTETAAGVAGEKTEAQAAIAGEQAEAAAAAARNKVDELNKVNTGGGGWKGALKSFGWTVAIGLSIAAVSGIIKSVNDAIDKANYTVQEQIEDLDNASTKIRNKLDETNSQLANFSSARTELEDSIHSLGKLKKGSAEWASSMHKVRTEINGILEKYPELRDYTETINGITTLTAEGWAEYEKNLLNTFAQQQATLNGLQIKQTMLSSQHAAEELNIQTTSITTEEEKRVKNAQTIGGWTGGIGGAIGGAALGVKLGSLGGPIGLAIGAILGAFLGVVIGDIAGKDGIEDGVFVDTLNDVALKAADYTIEGAAFSAQMASSEQIKQFLVDSGLEEDSKEFKELFDYISENGKEFDEHSILLKENEARLFEFGKAVGQARADMLGLSGEEEEAYTDITAKTTAEEYDYMYQKTWEQVKEKANAEDGEKWLREEAAKAAGYYYDANTDTILYQKNGEEVENFSKDEMISTVASSQAMEKMGVRIDDVFNNFLNTYGTEIGVIAAKAYAHDPNNKTLNTMTGEQLEILTSKGSALVSRYYNKLLEYNYNDKIGQAMKLQANTDEDLGIKLNYEAHNFGTLFGFLPLVNTRKDGKPYKSDINVDKTLAKHYLEKNEEAIDKVVEDEVKGHNYNYVIISHESTRANQEETYDISDEDFYAAIAADAEVPIEFVEAQATGQDLYDLYNISEAENLFVELKKYTADLPFLMKVPYDTALAFAKEIDSMVTLYDLGSYEDSFKATIQSIFDGVEQTQWGKIANLLANTDFDNLTELYSFNEFLKDIPGVTDSAIQEFENLINQLSEAGIATAEIDLESLIQQLESTQKIIKKINDLDLDEELTLSKEELNAVLSAGGDRNDFVATLDGYEYVGENMEELRKTIQRSNEILLAMQNKALQKKVNVGSVIAGDDVLKDKNWGATATWTPTQIKDVYNATLDAAIKNYNNKMRAEQGDSWQDITKEQVTEENWSTIVAGTMLQGYGFDFYKNAFVDSDFEKLWDSEGWDTIRIQIREDLAETADAFTNLPNYEQQLTEGLRDIEEQNLSVMSVGDILEQSSGQTYAEELEEGTTVTFKDSTGEMIEATVVGGELVDTASGKVYSDVKRKNGGYYEDSTGYGFTAIDNVLDSKIQQYDAEAEVMGLTRALNKQGSAVAKNNLLIKAAVAGSKEYEDKLKKVTQAIKDNEDALSKGKGTVEYEKALDNITLYMQNAFGTHISRDFVEKHLSVFQEWAAGAEGSTEKIRELLISALSDIPGMTADEVNAVKNALSELDNFNFEIYGHMDATQLFNQLTKVFGSVEDAKAAIESLGYNVEVRRVQVGTAPNGHPLYGYQTIVTNSTENVRTYNKPTSTGGGSDSKYENSHDKLYNQYEKINALIREREKLERRYDALLANRVSTGKELIKNSKEQIDNLKAQAELQEYVKNKKLEEVKDYAAENSKYSKYAWFDKNTGTVQINWDLINSVTNSDKGSAIDEYISGLEERRDQWKDAEEALDEIHETIKELREEGRDEYFDIEDRLKEALVNERQKEIDKLTDINDSINDTNSKLLEAMQSQIDEYRQARDNEKTEEELSDKQRRLAYLQQDTSGANATEILNLQKEIEEGQESYTDTLIDQKISELQKQNDQAAEQRQLQIDLLSAQLQQYQDSGLIWNDVLKILNEGTTAKGTLKADSRLVELLQESEGFQALSKLGQYDWTRELEEAFINAYKYINGGRVAKENETVTFKDKNGRTLTGTAIDNMGTVKVGNKTYSNVTQDEYSNWSTTEEGVTEVAKKTSSGSGNIASLPASISLSAAQVKKLQKGLNQLLSDKKLSGFSKLVEDGIYGAKTKAAVKILQKAIGTSADGVWGPNTKNKFASSSLKAYKTGGLADFTGPAWLDGTKTRPEYILSADQTKAFFTLVDVLSGLHTKDSQTAQNTGDNSFDIDINVESIGSDYDVEQMAETIKRLINDDARYRNNNAINLMR